ncbi:7083_t:CDS:1 [Funneliformis geosporum]|nr:7083_t:CDS:1 [Funneliformis geosporum]
MNKNKNIQSSSMDDLADALMNKLDRYKVFPPYYNNPEELLNPSKVRSVGPPRPPNGFLLCRKNVHRLAKERGICNMRVISKVTGMLWRGATLDEKEQYENLALSVQRLHSKRYPNYKYRPRARTDGPLHPLHQPYITPQQRELPRQHIITEQQPQKQPEEPLVGQVQMMSSHPAYSFVTHADFYSWYNTYVVENFGL